MKYYFKLQFTRLQRWLKELGVNLYLGLAFGLVSFFLLSKLLFYKTEYASWVYLIFLGSLLFNLCDRKRVDGLTAMFSNKDFTILRIIENSLLVVPFQIYLLFENEILLALVLLPVGVLFAFYRKVISLNKTIPSPFKKYPFEFIVGFRKTFWLIALAYFLVYQAIAVDNYNLGLFGMGIIFLISMSFYQKPEHEYFVWIHTCRTKQFLLGKFADSMICVSILSILALIAMVICFSENWFITIALYLVGFIFLGSMIVAKYSSYPFMVNLPHVILFSIGLLFPPILLIVIWIFYHHSKKKLEPILEC